MVGGDTKLGFEVIGDAVDGASDEANGVSVGPVETLAGEVDVTAAPQLAAATAEAMRATPNSRTTKAGRLLSNLTRAEYRPRNGAVHSRRTIAMASIAQ